MKNQHNKAMLWLFVLLSVLITLFVFGNSMKSGDASMAESDAVVAYVTHGWGGAAKTLEYARRKKKNILLYSVSEEERQ